MKDVKDLATFMKLTARAVKYWFKRLKVPPYVKGHGSHRWTPDQATELVFRWHCYWELPREKRKAWVKALRNFRPKKPVF